MFKEYPQSLMGIDEAGRGCLIGSMIIGVAIWDEAEINQLIALKVMDSKKYTSKKQKLHRIELAEKLKHKAKFYQAIEIPPQKIDEAVLNKRKNKQTKKQNQISTNLSLNLNILELLNMAQVITEHRCEKVYIDALSSPKYTYLKMKLILQRDYRSLVESIVISNEKMSINWLEGVIESTTVVAESKADVTYPIVSAAAIIGKTHRDNLIRNIEKEFHLPDNILASGYANKDIVPFLEAYREKIKSRIFPFIRYEWDFKPLQGILHKKPRKKSLLDF